MEKIYVFLADGFEEIEGLTVVDLLRRADQNVVTVSIGRDTIIKGAHDIILQADTTFNQVDFEDAKMLVLPGGGEGTTNLENFQPLAQLLVKFANQGGFVGAICAAPRILAGLGLLKGKNATCYPSVMEKLEGAQKSLEPVVTDGNIITSRGLGTAIAFSLELIRLLENDEKAREIADSVVYKQ